MRLLIDGLKYHCHAIKVGFTPIVITSNQLIHMYSKHGFLREAQTLFDGMPERNVFSWNTIIWAYVETQNLAKAEALFESAPEKDSVTYNSILSGFVRTDGYEAPALRLFSEMHSARERVRIDDFTLTTMLNLAARLCCLLYGRQLHSFMVKTANDLNRFAMSSLIDMYSKCGCFREACQVFKGDSVIFVDLAAKNAMIAAYCREGELEMARNLLWTQPELNDIITWNTLISGYAQNGYEEEAIELFSCMSKYGFRWNEHTFASVLIACSSLKNLKFGKEVHAWIVKHGMSSNSFISSVIVDLYCKCGNMKYAESVHAVYGVENPFSISSMIVGYSSVGNMEGARKLFDSLSEKNYVVWTAMIYGYVKSQQFEAVFELFIEFNEKNESFPDALIFVSVFNACAVQAAVNPGKQVHAYILRMGIEIEEKLLSAIIDMYSKCGNITYASKLFKRATLRDSVLYNVMIAGYAHHGYQSEGIELFGEMLHSGSRPDAVTFLALLSICRHSGLVELGEKYFHLMIEDYGIIPETDHYACMIDLYGRASLLEKAVAFMKEVPLKQDTVILGAFLNACKINKNVEFATEAEEEILKIEGHNGGRYALLANLYAAEGKWGEMGRIRKKMREKKVKKLVGCSWVYVENKVHIFTASDRSHSQTDAIYSMLVCLSLELNDMVRGR